MPEAPQAAQNFMGALMGTGYLMILVKTLEVLVGIALITNRFVALSLVILAPIAVNMVLFHLFLDPAGIGAAALVTIFTIILMFANKSKYNALLSAK
ncbi:DoxX protein [Cytophagales bacterium RKSG123]|nr:DoxX protein [Xanthovirga aplysinae]